MSVPVIVANAAITSGDDVLLLERSANLDNTGTFGLGGGLVDPTDASPFDAVLREIYEETGLESANLEVLSEGEYLLQTTDRNIADSKAPLHIYVFLMRLKTERPSIKLNPHEHISYKWVNMNDLIAGKLSNADNGSLLGGLPTMLAHVSGKKVTARDQTLTSCSLERIR